MTDSPQFPDEKVTVRQLAEALGVTVQGVHYHIREGHIPHERLKASHADFFVLVVDREVAERVVANYRRNKTWSAE